MGQRPDAARERRDRLIKVWLEPTERIQQRQAQLAAHDLHGAQRNPARVLLRVGVTLSEAERQRPDMRAEEGLLGEDEVGRMQVARERARLPPR